MEGQGLLHPMEWGYPLCSHSPAWLQWGLGVLTAADRGCAACQMVQRSHQWRGGHSRQDRV